MKDTIKDITKKGFLLLISIVVISGLGYYIYTNKNSIVSYFNKTIQTQKTLSVVEDIKQKTIINNNSIQKLTIVNANLYKKYSTLSKIIILQQQQITNLKTNYNNELKIISNQNKLLLNNKKVISILNKKVISLINNQNKLIDNLNKFNNELNLTKNISNKKYSNLTQKIKAIRNQIKKLSTKKSVIDLGFSYVGFAIEKGVKIGYISINSGRIFSIKTNAIINEIYKVVSIDKNVLIIQNQNTNKVYSLNRKK